jgi:hypothetical protein
MKFELISSDRMPPKRRCGHDDCRREATWLVEFTVRGVVEFPFEATTVVCDEHSSAIVPALAGFEKDGTVRR